MAYYMPGILKALGSGACGVVKGCAGTKGCGTGETNGVAEAGEEGGVDGADAGDGKLGAIGLPAAISTGGVGGGGRMSVPGAGM